MKTFDDAVDSYLATKQYQGLAISTKKQKLISISQLKTHLAGYPLAGITRPVVLDIKDEYYDSPGRCKPMLSTLKTILSHAFDKGWVTVNVAIALTDMPKSTPIARWSGDEIVRFLSTAPKHLQDVMMVALYTGQRRSDLCRMNWGDYDGISIHVIQQKTGKELYIPVHPALKMHLSAMKRRNWGTRQPILTNAFHAAWQPDSMRVAMKNHCRKIGIGEKQLHGVRKTTASMLAEMGCTPHQIAAITGHQSLKEVQRYTLEAEQKRMAEEAIEKWQ